MVTLGDLIRHKKKRKREGYLDQEVLLQVRPILQQFDSLVGMASVKQLVARQACYFLQRELHQNRVQMMHTVITGPPGVGKTKVGHLLAQLYGSLGVLPRGHVVSTRRSELIGQYLGETAIKTQKVVDSSLGGVLVIDEAYSLGGCSEDRADSYSKECFDTLNRNLTENSDKFVCVIMGYEKSLQDSFFSMNEGLERRFSFRINLQPYSAEELCLIFESMVAESGWWLQQDSCLLPLLREHHSTFRNHAGDVESFLYHVKFAHGVRMMEEKKGARVVTDQDLREGLVEFQKGRRRAEDDRFLSMYL